MMRPPKIGIAAVCYCLGLAAPILKTELTNNI